jgi:hypothetical protein
MAGHSWGFPRILALRHLDFSGEIWIMPAMGHVADLSERFAVFKGQIGAGTPVWPVHFRLIYFKIQGF